MHEMLGNQYFMIRNFSAAKQEFELAMEDYPGNLKIKKKLIVCYTQTGDVARAFRLFKELVETDIEIIVNTHPVADDCPCPELIPIIEKQEAISINPFEANLILAMLWLYCDKENSMRYFLKAQAQKSENTELAEVISKVRTYLDTHPPVVN